MTYALALAALAEPTRRAVFERLRRRAMSVNEVATDVPVSRPAVSQHLKVLKQAGLVVDRADGARRVYTIDREGLVELRRWIDSLCEVPADEAKAEAAAQDMDAADDS